MRRMWDEPFDRLGPQFSFDATTGLYYRTDMVFSDPDTAFLTSCGWSSKKVVVTRSEQGVAC